MSFRDRDNWLRAMMSDTVLSNGARLVAARLALHLNIGTGECDPAYSTLAKEIGMTRRGVIRAVSYVIERGWLGATNGGKRQVNQFGKHSNNFILRWPNHVVTAESPHGDRRVTNEVTVESPNGDHGVTNKVTGESPAWCPGSHPINEDKNKRKNKGNSDSNIGEMECPPSSCDGRDDELDSYDVDGDRHNSTNPESTGGNSSLDIFIDHAFERFWRISPRQIGQKAAHEALAAALKAGTDIEAILRGVERYAIERSGQDMKFTKHPGNWIAGECWNDQPTHGVVIDQDGKPVTPSKSGIRPDVIAGLQNFLNQGDVS